MGKTTTGLKRPRHPMPEFVRTALEDRNLMGTNLQHWVYQQNDYMKMSYRPKSRQK
jgi:hypothetical protein